MDCILAVVSARLFLRSLQNRKLTTPIAKIPSGTPTPAPIAIPRLDEVEAAFKVAPEFELVSAAVWAAVPAAVPAVTVTVTVA